MKFIQYILQYILQVEKVKYSEISDDDIHRMEQITLYYGIDVCTASNDENKYLVIFGEIHGDTIKECRTMLKGLKQKLKEIFHAKQITPLREMSGSIMMQEGIE